MKHSRSTLFLMELIISILFFSIASTVYIQLFVKSYQKSTQTTNELYAVTQTQNLAECFLATEGNLAQMEKMFPDAKLEGTEFKLYFDSKWTACNSEKASFTVTLISKNPKKNLCSADIFVENCKETENNIIYSLNIIHHIKERKETLETE